MSPASQLVVKRAEAKLKVQFPDSLRELLLQADGVLDAYESSFIWRVEDIVKRNIEFRSYPDFKELYMPFDHLLFFGDAGNGDQFGFPILGSEIRKRDVFAWNHEDDSRVCVAPSLEVFIEWWFTNKIRL